MSPVGPIVLGVGGALIVAGAITGGLALARNDDLNAVCGGDASCPPEARSIADEELSLAIATDVLLITGALAAATGVVLMFLLTESGAGASAMLVPQIGPDRAGLTLAGVFR